MRTLPDTTTISRSPVRVTKSPGLDRIVLMWGGKVLPPSENTPLVALVKIHTWIQVQPRPQGFSLKKWVGKSLGTRLIQGKEQNKRNHPQVQG